MAIKRKFIGEMLLEVGIITKEQLQECLDEQKSTGGRLGGLLQSKGYVTEQQLMEVMEDVITVSGQTDLIDGVILHISVHDQAGNELDSVNIIKNGDKISQDFQITNNFYDDSVKYILGYITCAPNLYGDQSDSVIKNYGEEFEYIDTKDGDSIWNNDGIMVLFGSEMVEF